MQEYALIAFVDRRVEKRVEAVVYYRFTSICRPTSPSDLLELEAAGLSDRESRVLPRVHQKQSRHQSLELGQTDTSLHLQPAGRSHSVLGQRAGEETGLRRELHRRAVDDRTAS